MADVKELNINNTTYDIKAKSVVDTNSGAVKMWTGTKAQYDAIVTKDATTLYNITDDTDTTLTLLELLFPVGAVYFGTMSTCPLETLGVGTWQALPPDKVIQIAGTRGSVGDTLNESLPNVKGNLAVWGSYGIWGLVSDASASDFNSQGGAFQTYSTGWTEAVQTGKAEASEGVNFDASRSSSAYQDDAPVQQDAYLLNGWRRIA
jgi:hypothetical protein